MFFLPSRLPGDDDETDPEETGALPATAPDDDEAWSAAMLGSRDRIAVSAASNKAAVDTAIVDGGLATMARVLMSSSATIVWKHARRLLEQQQEQQGGCE